MAINTPIHASKKPPAKSERIRAIPTSAAGVSLVDAWHHGRPSRMLWGKKLVFGWVPAYIGRPCKLELHTVSAMLRSLLLLGKAFFKAK